jgi:catechol 2,3-dioxygenase-like lactoylglutathione lyase family enzyme
VAHFSVRDDVRKGRLTVVLGHLGINVPDLAQARAYYDQLLPLLGYETFFSADDELAYMPSGGRRGAYLFVYPARSSAPYSREDAGLQHLAFTVPTRTAVRAVRERVAELGGEVLHPPQEFPQYPPPYFATFWLDPFGFMLEAVCHHDRD